MASVNPDVFAKLGTIDAAVASMMTSFNAAYDELVKETDLTHAGITERFKRFDVRFELQQERRTAMPSVGALGTSQMFEQGELETPFERLWGRGRGGFQQIAGRGSNGFTGARPIGRGLLRQRQNPFEFGVVVQDSGVSSLRASRAQMRQRGTEPQQGFSTGGGREIHVNLRDLLDRETMDRLLTTAQLRDNATLSTEEGRRTE